MPHTALASRGPLSPGVVLGAAPAGATGRAVVATRVGGVPEIVEHGRSGWLVEPSARSLCDGMLRVLSDRDLMERMSQAGMQRVREHFTWRQITDQYLGAYARIAS